MPDALAERIERQRRALRERAEADVRAVVSPYRICPIGAHIDHQEGPVLGMAIDAYTVLVFAPTEDGRVSLASENFPGEARFDLCDPGAGDTGPDWGRYARGAAWALRERLPERPRGIEGRLSGSLPGSGLSSSASALLAYLRSFASANDVDLAPSELVRLSRRAENDYVGLASGILDPASIAGARRGHLVAIDTKAERFEAVPLGPGAPGYRILVAFTGRTRALTGTRFNARVEECRAAAARLGELARVGPVRHLGDLDDRVFAEHLDALPGPLRRRARHFAGERARVLEGLARWRAGDLSGFGARMWESCRSSIENFETGSPELVRLQEILAGTPGVLGARFSGAGFGGCGVALVEEECADDARERALRAFGADFPSLARDARFFLARSEDGLRIVSP